MTNRELSAAMLQKLHNCGVYVELLDNRGMMHTLMQITGDGGATFYKTWDGKTFSANDIQHFHFIKR